MIKRKDESIFIDFIYLDGEIPQGFVSSFTIEKNGKTIKQSRLQRREDNRAFLLRIQSGELEDFKEGDYRLLVAVENANIGYKDYIYNEELIIRS